MEQMRREMLDAVLRYLAEIAVDKDAFLLRLEKVSSAKIKDSAMNVDQ